MNQRILGATKMAIWPAYRESSGRFAARLIRLDKYLRAELQYVPSARIHHTDRAANLPDTRLDVPHPYVPGSGCLPVTCLLAYSHMRCSGKVFQCTVQVPRVGRRCRVPMPLHIPHGSGKSLVGQGIPI